MCGGRSHIESQILRTPFKPKKLKSYTLSDYIRERFLLDTILNFVSPSLGLGVGFFMESVKCNRGLFRFTDGEKRRHKANGNRIRNNNLKKKQNKG